MVIKLASFLNSPRRFLQNGHATLIDERVLFSRHLQEPTNTLGAG
ncbi:hypothetical protein yaldo0001_31080 [Yersinia aldovae ATCC 35236]|nr:hypothetical protein yaldo0001_31080 [Yersinia aldovae ATCC 35236]